MHWLFDTTQLAVQGVDLALQLFDVGIQPGRSDAASVCRLAQLGLQLAVVAVDVCVGLAQAYAVAEVVREGVQVSLDLVKSG